MASYTKKTLFLDCEHSSELIRYDLIVKKDTVYVVKVFDTQINEFGGQKNIIEIDEFTITMQKYNEKYNTLVPSFDGNKKTFQEYIAEVIQEHRNKLAR